MAFEEASVPSEVHLSTGPCNDKQAMIDLSNAFTINIPRSLRNYDQLQPTTPPIKSHRRTSLRDLILGSPTSPKTPKPGAGKIRRLGVSLSSWFNSLMLMLIQRSELGPYAHEKQMPNWLRKMLEEGAKVTITNQLSPNGTIIRVEAIANETPDVVPVLARLSALDSSVERAYYCDPAVHYVSKMPKEGGFCGYRNIQMLVSYIRTAVAFGHEHFDGPKIPSILRLQDMIEDAWDMGFNATGKIETGGIRLTRKYIGTPEAQALFQSLGIPCEASAFSRSINMKAHENLLFAVAHYFRSETHDHSVLHRDGHDNQVIITRKPPIYFQHRGHSMTIVGWESRYDGGVNLIVFDPMFQPNATIKSMAVTKSLSIKEPAKMMKAHRRGESYLAKYHDFELLQLTASPPVSKTREP